MTKFIAHVREMDSVEQSVKSHLTETAELAAEFADKIGLREQGEILGLLHDFGKYSQEFQSYIQSGQKIIDQDDEHWVNSALLRGKIDHSTAGAQYVWKHLKGLATNKKIGELCGQILALCIASHHSGLINCISISGERDFLKRMGKAVSKTHLDECKQRADTQILTIADSLLNLDFIKNFFQHIRSTSDLSNGNLSRTDAFRLGMLTRFLFSCLIDADRLNSAEFENPYRKSFRIERQGYFDWNVAIQRLNEKLNSIEEKVPIDSIRKSISDICFEKSESKQGIYTLTVPTGGGKTLASLRFALHHANHHNLERIFYIIPYTSIIEQNAKAVREIIEKRSDKCEWVLEHHSNLEPDRRSWRSKLVSDNWDAPIVFTTMVQFLEVLFSDGTRSTRRMHQLANSVLIFDEIQTIPVKCIHLFCNAINYLTDCAKTTTILCTATQPLLDNLPCSDNGQLRLADNSEIVDDREKLFNNLSRVKIENRIKKGGWSEWEITELATNNFQEKGSCLVIVNTKAWAQKLYHSCRQHIDEGSLFHLSTNQCAAHRKDIIKIIRQRLEADLPVLCISTQLIEAGVDIDFASVVRFLAGLDSIAQAAGRCNRNGKLQDKTGNYVKGTVDVINPDKESIHSLKDIKEGREVTQRIFADSDGDDFLSPDVIGKYFEHYLSRRVEDMKYPVNNKRGHSHNNILNWLSDNFTRGSQNQYRANSGTVPLMEQAFKDAGEAFKAIDVQARPIVVPYQEGKQVINKLCSLAKDFDAAGYYRELKTAQRYTVNIFQNLWDELIELGAIHETQEGEGVFYLDNQYYTEEFGLHRKDGSRLELLMMD